MEIVGLVIIVILITLIFLFLLQFKKSEPDTQRKRFIQEELASNALSAILRADSGCYEKNTMTELFQDCGRNKKESLGVSEGTEIECDNGAEKKGACIIIKDKVKSWLESLLKEKNIDYRFYGTVTGLKENGKDEMMKLLKIPEDNNKFDNSLCERERKVEIYPVPLYPSSGTLFLRLEICG